MPCSITDREILPVFPKSMHRRACWPATGAITLGPGRDSDPDALTRELRNAVPSKGTLLRVEHTSDSADACLYIDASTRQLLRLRYRVRTRGGVLCAERWSRTDDAERHFLACAVSLARRLRDLDQASVVEALAQASQLERRCRVSLASLGVR